MLWKEGSAKFKEFIFHDEERPLKMFVTFDLHWIQDVNIIEVIFKDLNTQQKRNTILSEDILFRCSNLIRKDKWDSVNSFINCTFFSDEDISQMKKVFVPRYGIEFAVSFLREREFHKLDRFLN